MNLFKPYHIATTNAHKLREIALAGFNISAKKPDFDAPEPLASLSEIIIDKSRRAGPMSIVEDTAVFIDGFPDAGVTIKKFEKDRRMHEAIGFNAAYRVAMAINDGTTIFVVERALLGVIVPPVEDPSGHAHSYDGYAFSQFFKPVEFKTTYDATITEFAIPYSPRVRCVKVLQEILVGRINYARFNRLTSSAEDAESDLEKEIAFLLRGIRGMDGVAANGIVSYAPSNGPLWTGAFQEPC